MKTTLDNTNNYLYHHGILGQKWGIRRFQNADGSLTPEGRSRYKKIYRETGPKHEIDQHSKSGDTKSEKVALATNVALDLLMLNPVGLAADITRVGASVYADKKEAKSNERLANAKVDKKTGLKLKSEETTAEKDVKMVNPGFYNFNSNTKNNCVLCSTAFELRRRGYDVVAAKAGVGYSANEYLSWWKGAKRTSYYPESFYKGSPRSMSELKEHMAENRKIKQEKGSMTKWLQNELTAQGDGARGYLSFIWTNFAGHSTAYVVQNGKVYIYDAQCGRKMKLNALNDYMVNSINVNYTRLDDKEPNYAAMKKAGVI